MSSFPFLTLPDPKATAEGALDPLGLSNIGERLAEGILPGLRARMARPRFLTVMAVCARVCEGLDEDGSSEVPAYLVFEWLLVEGFVRCADADVYRRTPGTAKAQAVRDSGEVMCARNYLRIPTVFGVNGVYKPLARNLDLVNEVDGQFHLNTFGHELLKIWQDEQGLAGFIPNYAGEGRGTQFWTQLRDAVKEGMTRGYTQRSGAWAGWHRLADHLAPKRIGRREAAFLRKLFLDGDSGLRSEIFRLLRPAKEDASESLVITESLLPKASKALSAQLNAIVAYEQFAGLLEQGFDWIRYLSSQAGAKAVTSADFAKQSATRRIATALPRAIERTDKALEKSDHAVLQLFSQLAKSFDRVTTADELFEAVLTHHSTVQKAKPPAGKRDWFERDPGGATFVRVPYQIKDVVEPSEEWGRPYRINSVRSFLSDFAGAA